MPAASAKAILASVAGGEVETQFPHTAHPGRLRIPLGGHHSESREKLPLLVASREYVPDGFGQGTVGEGFDPCDGI